MVVYRPANCSPSFVDIFTECVTNLRSRFQQFLVVGDFNYHWDQKPRAAQAQQLEDTLTSLGFKQLVNSPTHEKGHTLDLVWTTFSSVNLVDTTPCEWSDHYFINLLLPRARRDLGPPPNWKLVRSWNKIQGPSLESTLRENLIRRPKIVDMDEWTESICSQLSFTMNKLAPAKRIKTGNKGKGAP